MNRFSCPVCNSIMRANPYKPGRKVNCLACGQKVRLPVLVNRTKLGKPAAVSVKGLPWLAAGVWGMVGIVLLLLVTVPFWIHFRNRVPAGDLLRASPATCKEVYELLVSRGMNVSMYTRRVDPPAIWVLDRDGHADAIAGSGELDHMVRWGATSGWVIVTQHPTAREAEEVAGAKNNAYSRGRFVVEGDEPLLTEIKRRF